MPLKIANEDSGDMPDPVSHSSTAELLKRLKLACDHADEIRLLMEFLDPEWKRAEIAQ